MEIEPTLQSPALCSNGNWKFCLHIYNVICQSKQFWGWLSPAQYFYSVKIHVKFIILTILSLQLSGIKYIHRVVQPWALSTPRIFHHPEWKAHIHKAVTSLLPTFPPHPLPLTTTNLLSISMDLPILHIIYGIKNMQLCFWFLSLRMVFLAVYPCRSM